MWPLAVFKAAVHYTLEVRLLSKSAIDKSIQARPSFFRVSESIHTAIKTRTNENTHLFHTSQHKLTKSRDRHAQSLHQYFLYTMEGTKIGPTLAQNIAEALP